MAASLHLDGMLDLQRGTISREIFVSPKFHRAKLEKLFTRALAAPGRLAGSEMLECRTQEEIPVKVSRG